METTPEDEDPIPENFLGERPPEADVRTVPTILNGGPFDGADSEVIYDEGEPVTRIFFIDDLAHFYDPTQNNDDGIQYKYRGALVWYQKNGEIVFLEKDLEAMGD